MTFFNINKSKIDIYTDGSCSGNPGPGGWSGIIVHENISIISGFEQTTTNNRMELLATINSIKAINKNIEINLFTDSNYVKNGITVWIKNWINSDWKNSQKKEVANKDLWMLLLELDNTRKIDWFWIKGHSSSNFNNLADKFAVLSMKNQTCYEIKNYDITNT